MTSTPAINVYVQIPSALADDGRPILDPDNWKWVLLLVFPLNRLRPLLFLHKPYKWLRYCAGISLGTTGTFCNTAASPNINDSFEYDAGLPTKSEDLYFHTTDPEKAQMFPIDPLMVKNPGRSTSGSTTSHRDDFREEVKERDGNVCVVTGLDADLTFCEAAHLVAHGQGDAYIETLTTRRRHDELDIIYDIDSVRNGIILNPTLHLALGEILGMLKTPNFAMSTRDVDPNTSDASEARVFVHLLHHEAAPIIFPLVNGSAIRLSESDKEGRTRWPSDVLLEAVYASAVLHQFGQVDVKKDVTAVWEQRFYPGSALNTLERDERKLGELRDNQGEKRLQRRDDRKARNDRRTAHKDADSPKEDVGSDSEDSYWLEGYVAPPVLAFMSPELQKAWYKGAVRRAKAAQEEAEAAALKDTEEKISHWQEGIECATHDVEGLNELEIKPEVEEPSSLV